MIGWKTVLVLSNIAVYVILFIGLVKVIETNMGSCTNKNPCIRFCSKNNDSDLLKRFTESINSAASSSINGGRISSRFYDSRDFIVFHGQPECIDEINKSTIKNYEYNQVSLKLSL